MTTPAGQTLVQLHGENAGQPWAPDAARVPARS